MPTSVIDNSTFPSPSGQLLPATGWQSDVEDRAASSFMPTSSSLLSVQRGRPVRRLEVAELTAQLAIMTKSGVDLASSLSSLASQCQRPALARVLAEVCDSILSGSSFSDALKLHPTVFDPTFVATVAAGEASGRMAEVLQQLASMQKKEIRRGREIRALLTYPVLLLLVSSSVLGALVLFVLPRFTEIFDQYEMPLPVITQFLLAFADELRARWWLWGPLAVGALVGLLVWRKTESGRIQLDRFWIRGPLIGEVCCGMCIGATCRLLGLMLDNGVTLLESLRLTRQAIGNTLYKGLLSDLEEAVVNGQGLANVLHQTEVVPPSAKEMLITAESTGNLNEVTSLLGEYYEDESEAKLRQLVGVLEPVITVVMGGVVAVVVLAVMLPVFNLSTFAAGGN
ncbi:MAG: type II secretion system F family protein [Planctomycetes bacterium]|nr:type II secretion system F family protein [Planctomycetota bacterium]